MVNNTMQRAGQTTTKPSFKEGATGKQRELAERDQRYLAVARRLLLDEGIAQCTVNRVAQETGFSKVTLYQRFRSKEQLLVEVGLGCRQELAQVTRCAARLEGPPRVRLEAIGYGIGHYAKRYAENVRILSMIDSEVVLTKAPEELQEQMAALDVEIFGLMADCVHRGIEAGDLVLPPNVEPHAIVFLMWTSIDGWAHCTGGGAPMDEIELRNPFEALALCIRHLLDAFGWRPLMREWDYEQTSREVYRLLAQDPLLDFAEE